MYAYIYCVKNGGPFYKPVPKVEEWKITNIFYNSWKSISSPLIERPQTVDWQISLPLMVPRKSFCLCIFFATREEFQLYRSLRFDQISRKHFPLWKLIYEDFQLNRSMRFDLISRKQFPLWKLMYEDFQLYRSMRFDLISRKHFPLWKLMY